MNLPHFCRSLYVDNDTLHLISVAGVLSKLQSSFGLITNVVAKGDLACAVAGIFKREREEMERDKESVRERDSILPSINTVFVVDRNVDFFSTLLTQQSFEGLLDEIMDVDNGTVQVPKSVVDAGKDAASVVTDKAESRALVRVGLNASTPLYSEIRGLNFRAVAQFLHKRAEEFKEMKDNYGRNQGNLAIDQLAVLTKQLKVFAPQISNLPFFLALTEYLSLSFKLPSFENRINAELLLLQGEESKEDYVDGVVNEAKNLEKVLRIICLACACGGG